SAIHIRFDIKSSTLPEFYKQRLLALSDHRNTEDGVIIIKSQEHRPQEKNREEALKRLKELMLDAVKIKKKRRA
ncbi:aminoacyl-tRNA hydrolase, partial [Psychromonas aquatilis]